MQGLDVHLDTNIGKRLSVLGTTLTAFTRDQDEDEYDGIDGQHLEASYASTQMSKPDHGNRKSSLSAG